MKTIIVMFFSLLLSYGAVSQGLFKTLTDRYATQEGFSATNLTRDMFDLYLKKKQTEANSPVNETIRKLDNILVVTYNALPSGKDTATFLKTTEIQKIMLDYYNENSFTLFKTENRNGEDLKVYLKKTGEKVNSLSLISATPIRLTLVELDGDIDLAGISEINSALGIRGLENLYKINSRQDNFALDLKMPQGSWNTLSDQQFFNQHELQLSLDKLNQLNTERMKEWTLQQKDFTREQQKVMAEKQKEMAVKQKEMAEKYRQMAEKYGRHPIFLSAPGDTNMVYFIDGKKVTVNEINKIASDQIESISIVKPDKDHPGKKGEMRIKTKK